MKKTYRLKDLGCANCAAKMERAILKIHGVQFVQVNFMTQRLILEAEDKDFENILQQAKKYIQRIEPDCMIVGG